MNKKLPERPNLDQLKKQAKDLLNAISTGQPEALARVPENERARFTLADAQRILAREYGFPSWTKLKERVELALSGPALAARTLVRASLEGNGEKVAAALREYPRLSRASIGIAAVLGDSVGVQDWIRHNPALATKRGAVENWSPLLSACVGRVGGDDTSRAECVRLLLAAGADANDYRIDDSFPDARLPVLYYATGRNNYPQVARVLLAAGANPNDNESVYHAAERNHTECLAALLEAGADLSQRNEQWKNTPLYFLLGHSPVTPQAQKARGGIWWLLDHGADPNVPAYEVRETPLWLAIRNGWDTDLIRHFLDRGADPNARRADGTAVYAEAVRTGRADIAALLEKHGARAEFSVRDEFLGAVATGRLDRARVLRDGDTTLRRETPAELKKIFMETGARGELAAIEAAHALGLELLAPDAKGETILHYAALHGQLPVARRLLALGARVDVRDTTYHAPPLGWCVHGSIHFRTQGGDYPAVAEALLAAGADVIPIPREQLSPAMLAVFDRRAEKK